MASGLRRPQPVAGETTDTTATETRRGRRVGRTRVAAARGAWAMGSVMLTIARIIRLAVGIVAAIIVAAILLRVFDANTSNSIVSWIHDAGSTLVGPFKNLFTIKNPKVSIAVNWGLAALAWLIVGGFIASLIARMAPRGVAPGGTV